MDAVAYDLAVCGGGPAGTAAAITASRLGARVLLLERGRLPRHKVCGEFVSAESLGLLGSLLADTPGESLLAGARRITRARFFADGSSAQAELRPAAASVARYDLDYALWQGAARRGANCRQQTTVEGIECLSDASFRLSTSAGEFQARSVIDASGRWSNLSRPVPGRERNSWIALKAHFSGEEEGPFDSVDLYFFRSGYCGVQPLGGGRLNVAAMVRAEVLADKQHLLRQLFSMASQLENRSRHWRQVTDLTTTAPLLFRTPVPECGGILRAGDAGGFVDPFVGDGISLALQTGVAAARALQVAWSGAATIHVARERYRRFYQEHVFPVFATAGHVRRLLGSSPALRRLLLAVLGKPAMARYLIRRTRVATKSW